MNKFPRSTVWLLQTEKSTTDFVAFLRNSGIESVVIRRSYGYAVNGLQHALGEVLEYHDEDSSAVEILYLVFQSGFTELDPQGVAEFRGELVLVQ